MDLTLQERLRVAISYLMRKREINTLLFQQTVVLKRGVKPSMASPVAKIEFRHTKYKEKTRRYDYAPHVSKSGPTDDFDVDIFFQDNMFFVSRDIFDNILRDVRKNNIMSIDLDLNGLWKRSQNLPKQKGTAMTLAIVLGFFNNVYQHAANRVHVYVRTYDDTMFEHITRIMNVFRPEFFVLTHAFSTETLTAVFNREQDDRLKFLITKYIKEKDRKSFSDMLQSYSYLKILFSS